MKEYKNIVIVCDYAFFEGGAANVAMQSVLAFAKYTDLNVYCFAGSGQPCEELKKSRAKVIALGMPDLLGNKNRIDAFLKGIYNKKAGEELKKLLSTLYREETVVHIHTWTKVLSSSVFKVCEEMNFKTYLTVHEYFLACPNGACYNYVDQKICELEPMSKACLKCNCDARSYLQKLWRYARQAKQNSVIRHNDKLNYIFISPYQEKQLLRRIPEIKHKYLVKNPINVGERMQIEAEKNSDFVYIGRLSGEKGPQMFCEAVTKAQVHGVVIGKGILEDELKSKYPNIVFTGWKSKEQINEQLKQTRALVFPTLWYEGSPLTVPEVQAHGIPCIVTDCSSATDDIVQGENGEVVKADVGEIVAAINRFEDNEYAKKLSRNAYQMFDEKRGSEKWYVDNLMRIYKGY
ncbi:MAG: glycosyltransferase family 4 protein [Lachnospiraceae bacterium]|nr:glycosyltransferase family 4 protein [Lachnospiraceae bacterium]